MPKDKFPNSPKMTVYQMRTQVLEVQITTAIDLESEETRGEYYHAIIDATLTQHEHETHEEYMKRLNVEQTRAIIKEIELRAKETIEREYSTWIVSDAFKVSTSPWSETASVVTITARINVHDSGGKEFSLPEPEREKASRQ